MGSLKITPAESVVRFYDDPLVYSTPCQDFRMPRLPNAEGGIGSTKLLTAICQNDFEPNDPVGKCILTIAVFRLKVRDHERFP